MVGYPVSQFSISKVVLTLLVCTNVVAVHGMFRLPNRVFNAVFMRNTLAKQNFSKFQKTSLAALSSQNSNYNQNNYGQGRKNNRVYLGAAVGILGAGAYAATQNLQNNSAVNDLMYEIENNKSGKKQPAFLFERAAKYAKKPDFNFTKLTNNVLRGAAKGLQNLMGMYSLEMESSSILIDMPSKDELVKRLNSIGFGHLAENTFLVDHLADRQRIPAGVALEIETALYDYFKYLKKTGSSKEQIAFARALYSMSKPMIYEALLEGHPDALKELEERGWYTPRA